MNAKIYLRRNGSFGSSCDDIQDTGHEIREDSGKFTVWNHEGYRICRAGSREEAEASIAADWRAE